MFQKTKDRKLFLDSEMKRDLGDIVSYTNDVFDYAIEQKVSDVHIEPNREFVTIRFREDGDFVFVDKISHEEYTKLLSRVKILANLRIDEKQRPQDGKIAYESERYNELVDIRVSVLPLTDGEKIVMRLLRQDTSLLSLDKLEFLPMNLAKIKKNLESMYGIILVAGPTGSGKSTTLFSMLNHFDPLEYNISTLEDPVEYNIPYINQSQIKPAVGYDFATGLRSLVRQDPDIIMVGEIRDKETATLAIEAALTGHLVLSTIHTNSAASTIQRLVNMGIEPFLIASALKMVISQRLVKRLCTHCATKKTLDDPNIVKRVEEHIGGLVDDKIEKIEFGEKNGCPQCGNEGTSGRLGVHEVLVMEDAITPLILQNASAHEIEKKARDLGMISIVQDALIKSAFGKTTVKEALQLV